VRIGDVDISDGAVYVIAEIGVNHDGDPERAIALTDAAANAGADAVKLQYFQTDRLMTPDAQLASYQRAAGETDPVAMLRRLELPLDTMRTVIESAHARGVHAIVTVFSVELVPSASALPWDAFKSASPDIVHRPLLEALAETGRPLIVSTGAADTEEIARTRRWLDAAHDRLAFLHCVSSYPTPPEGANLGAIRAVRELASPCPAGYSDHTALTETGAAAVAHGACILEKHLTDDRGRAGPDHAASLEPAEFAEYTRLARAAASGAHSHVDAHLARTLAGDGVKRVLPHERDVRRVSRQSIVARRALEPGRVLTPSDLTFARPGGGLEPWRTGELVGRTLGAGARRGEPIALDHLCTIDP
jgi:N,N'-diacetyllegionaminate synthase